MPLYIKDDRTARAAGELTADAEFARAAEAIPLRERLARLRATHPLPPATGKAADKVFFDTLSGEWGGTAAQGNKTGTS